MTRPWRWTNAVASAGTRVIRRRVPAAAPRPGARWRPGDGAWSAKVVAADWDAIPSIRYRWPARYEVRVEGVFDGRWSV